MPKNVDKQPARISAMFDRVAQRYDRTNIVLSGGLDYWWRYQLRRAIKLTPGQLCLDVAAGTAVSSAELARSGAYVVACDFSLGMLRQGRDRGIPLVAGDAMRLPFASNVFDAVTIAFGLRNVADPLQALKEFARVTKPGGRLVVCEFSSPPWLPFRLGYQWYRQQVMPLFARLVSSDPEAYQYLNESIASWPNQVGLATVLKEAGWQQIAWRNLTGGVVALHRAVRP